MSLPGAERGRYARLLAGGFDLVIEGAVAYRLSIIGSADILGEYPDSESLFRDVVRLTSAGTPPHRLAMGVRLASGRYVQQGRGSSLVRLAEMALGIPRERRSRRGTV
jgi:hypothetical protein